MKGSGPVSYRYIIWSLSLSMFTMAIVLWLTYEPGMLEKIAPKRLPGLFIALVVSVLRVFFMTAKMRFLSEGALNWMASLRVALSWDFASMVMPSTIGGAPMAIYAMAREGISVGKSTALMLYAMLLDQLWFVCAIPFLLYAGTYVDIAPESVGLIGEGAMLMVYVWMLIYASILTYGVLIKPASLISLVHIVFRFPLLRNYKSAAEIVTEGLVQASEDLRRKSLTFLFKGFLISSLAWLARIWIATIVVLSFVPADVFHSFIRSLAMHLAGLIMPTPGGSGGLEGLFVLFQGSFMVERSYVIGISVFMWRLIGYYLTFAMGLFVATWYVNQSVINRNQAPVLTQD